jgi:hypothetical protein
MEHATMKKNIDIHTHIPVFYILFLKVALDQHLCQILFHVHEVHHTLFLFLVPYQTAALSYDDSSNNKIIINK